jgi:hypothetical protein
MPDPSPYRSRLTPWCIVAYPSLAQIQPRPQIIARHRKRSDAEAQLQLLRQLQPQQTYLLLFDPPTPAPDLPQPESDHF